MAVGCTRARMGAGTWGSSSGALSMALDTTILGMEIVGLVGLGDDKCVFVVFIEVTWFMVCD